jgi:uncharacterized protein involved in exopolysaccharide biosynthesis
MDPGGIDDSSGLLLEIVRRAYRQRRVAAYVAFSAACLLSIVAIGLHIPRYTADTLVVLSSSPKIDFNKGTPQPIVPIDPFIIRADTEVMQSAAICRVVIKKLNLLSNQDYTRKAALVSLSQSASRWIWRMIRPATLDSEPQGADRVEAAVLDYQSRLAVVNDGRSSAVHIKFTSSTPELAADIANEHARVYIAEQMKRRTERNEQIVSGLENELNSRAHDLATVQTQIQQLQRGLGSGSADPGAAGAELRALEVVASSKRDAYSVVLAAFNTAVSEQRLNFPDARIASAALPGSTPPSSRLMLAITVGAASIGLGLLAAVAVDFCSNSAAEAASPTRELEATEQRI